MCLRRDPGLPTARCGDGCAQGADTAFRPGFRVPGSVTRSGVAGSRHSSDFLRNCSSVSTVAAPFAFPPAVRQGFRLSDTGRFPVGDSAVPRGVVLWCL